MTHYGRYGTSADYVRIDNSGNLSLSGNADLSANDSYFLGNMRLGGDTSAHPKIYNRTDENISIDIEFGNYFEILRGGGTLFSVDYNGNMVLNGLISNTGSTVTINDSLIVNQSATITNSAEIGTYLTVNKDGNQSTGDFRVKTHNGAVDYYLLEVDVDLNSQIVYMRGNGLSINPDNNLSGDFIVNSHDTNKFLYGDVSENVFTVSGDTFVSGKTSAMDNVILIDEAPRIVMRDSNCSDSDNNFYIEVSATDTGSGTEDVDVAMYAQKSGSGKRYIYIDGDASSPGLIIGDSGYTTQILGSLESITMNGNFILGGNYIGYSNGFGLQFDSNNHATFDGNLTVNGEIVPQNQSIIGNNATLTYTGTATLSGIDVSGCSLYRWAPSAAPAGNIILNFSAGTDKQVLYVENVNTQNTYALSVENDYGPCSVGPQEIGIFIYNSTTGIWAVQCSGY